MSEQRTPPHSEDAEIAVLASILQEPEMIAEVRPTITAAAFCLARHRQLFGAMLRMHDADIRIDPVTLKNRLLIDGVFELDGGGEPGVYIGYLIDAVPTAVNASAYARIVAKFAAQRQLITEVTAAVELAWSEKTDPTKLAQQLLDRLLPLAAPTGREGYVLASDELLQIAEGINARRELKGLIGVPTGFDEIDKHTGGWRDGELAAICGVPKAGKTAVLQAFLQNNVLDGMPVGVVSLEMTRAELLERMMVSISGVPAKRVRNGDFSEAEMQLLGKAALRIKRGGALFIDETPGQQLGEVVARARALKMRHPEIRALYVDYLQLIDAQDETRAEELRAIAYGLKNLAKQLMVPIVVAAQLNGKKISERGDKRPTPDDIQGSSGLHQAAHYVALLYRPGMYEIVHHDRIELSFAATRGVGEFIAVLDADLAHMRLRGMHNPKPTKQESLDV